MANSPIIQLLNQNDFGENDFQALVTLLRQDPISAAQLGSHTRSTIWVCCQHSNCVWRRAIIPPLLMHYDVNVNMRADNEFTPLDSLYKGWTAAKEHKRTMAQLLVHFYDAKSNAVNEETIRYWLEEA